MFLSKLVDGKERLHHKAVKWILPQPVLALWTRALPRWDHLSLDNMYRQIVVLDAIPPRVKLDTLLMLPSTLMNYA